MRISELVEALNKAKDQHGDIEVYMFEDGCSDFEPIRSVFYSSAESNNSFSSPEYVYITTY